MFSIFTIYWQMTNNQIYLLTIYEQRKTKKLKPANIKFKVSFKIIAWIFSEANYFLRISKKNTNSEMFIEYIDDLKRCIRSKEYYLNKRFWVLLDNVSFYKNIRSIKKLKEVFRDILFFYLYSSQFASIKLFFNILIQKQKKNMFNSVEAK